MLFRSMIDEINRSLPSFKGIRSYFYSFQDMIQTTTMKVRRGMEMDNLKVLYEQSKENWQALRGANIDKLTAAAEESQNSTEAKDNTSGLTAEGSDKKVAKPEKENSILENMRLKELKRARHRYYRELRVINRMRENIEKRRGLLAEDERNLEICEAVLKQRLNKIKQTIEVDGSASPKALLQEN